MATGRGTTTHGEVGNAVAQIWERELGAQVTLDTETDGSFENCQKLLNGEVDLALAQSDVAIELYRKGIRDHNIRVVLPLYNQILFIIAKKGHGARSLKELVQGKRVGVSMKGSGTYFLCQEIFSHFGIKEGDYTPAFINDTKKPIGYEADVICTVTGFNNPKLDRLLNDLGGEIFSFDSPALLNQGSILEGFTLQYPLARPFIIPKNNYGIQPSQPVLTLCVRNLLLAREELDPILIYDLANALHQNKEELVQANPLFQEIPRDLNGIMLGFPIHEGTQLFLSRDAPTFWERYAELLGVLVSLFVVLLGLIPVGLRYLASKRRSAIILTFYKRILSANAVTQYNTPPEKLRDIINELENMETEVFDLVLAKKLETDAYFSSLIQYLQNTLHKLSESYYRENGKLARNAEV
jgi:TRAP transporter TAXI family solute receptor